MLCVQASVAQLKAGAAESCHIAVDRQRLIFQGHELQNHSKVKDVGALLPCLRRKTEQSGPRPGSLCTCFCPVQVPIAQLLTV